MSMPEIVREPWSVKIVELCARVTAVSVTSRTGGGRSRRGTSRTWRGKRNGRGRMKGWTTRSGRRRSIISSSSSRRNHEE